MIVFLDPIESSTGHPKYGKVTDKEYATSDSLVHRYFYWLQKGTSVGRGKS